MFPLNLGYRAACAKSSGSAIVLRFQQMRNVIAVRLSEDLSEWLEAEARKTGVPKERIVREAGAMAGPGDLSMRKGFSRK
jgi:hypothetical protein